jgi:transposase
MSDKQDEQLKLMQYIISHQAETIAGLNSTIESLNQTIANLNETIAEFQRKLFGSSCEKTAVLNNQASEEENSEEDAAEADCIKVQSHNRIHKPKSKRADLYANLPVREVLCDVPEENRTCPDCGTAMERLGYKFVREELRIIPAKVERIQYMQEVLVCPACKSEDVTTIIAAATPTALLVHSPASPSIVAYVIYQKYVNSIPFYRQELDWKQQCLPLPRETSSHWCIYCALEYFQPIYDRLHEYLLQREIIHADEVPCQVLHEEGKAATSTSYFWIYLSGNDGMAGIILYEYQPGRGSQYPKDFLSGFTGMLHCDGYAGYNKVENVTLVCCLAHCRRKFFEAIPKAKREKRKLLDINSEEAMSQPDLLSKEKTAKKMLPAEIGFDYCNQLFYLERTYKELTAEERKEKRLVEEQPIWDEFWNWLDTTDPLGGSAFEKAVNYAKNHQETLNNYLLDGRCEISNNRAERRAKSYVTGRKNFLFHDTTDGARASAIIYSLVETAKANHLNIFQYLYTLLLYMPDYKNEPAGIEALMPWSDFIRERCSGAMNTEKETPENRGSIPV